MVNGKPSNHCLACAVDPMLTTPTRSLIALSLIMSLLQFKPAPMYILDEIDAALDLSHTQHIGQLFRTRSKARSSSSSRSRRASSRTRTCSSGRASATARPSSSAPRTARQAARTRTGRRTTRTCRPRRGAREGRMAASALLLSLRVSALYLVYRLVVYDAYNRTCCTNIMYSLMHVHDDDSSSGCAHSFSQTNGELFGVALILLLHCTRTYTRRTKHKSTVVVATVV